MKISRGAFFSQRVLVMLVVLLGAWAMYQGSRSDDPRFYLFLQTRAGHLLARVFGWNRLGPDVVPEVEESRMSAEERSVKYQWERQLAVDLPLHRLVLNSGVGVEGRLVRETPEAVVFEESYGDSGVTLRFDRKRVARIERLSKPAYSVSYRDVLFRMEFPTLHFYKHAPYTIAADDKLAALEPAVEALDELHRNVVSIFGELMTRSPSGGGIQVVFFTSEDVFRSYRKRYAPSIDSAVGFYSPRLDRLVVLNDFASVQRDAEWSLENALAEYRSRHGTNVDEAALADWRARVENRMRSDAEEQTLATIRHEGAHQLFYTTGIHSDFRAENGWLTEGLAVYCETAFPGQVDPARRRLLRRAAASGELIPVEDLVNARDASGLMVFGPDPIRVDLAYGEAWALVRMLTEESLRRPFFDYLRFLRDPKHVNEVARKPAWDILCRELGIASGDLKSRYESYLQDL